MKLRVWCTKFLIKYPYIFWLLGFLLPIFYFTYLLNFKKVLKALLKKDKVMTFLFAFFLLQIFSTLLSIFYPFFTFGRFAAMSHNLLAYSFVFFGYAIASDDFFRQYLKENIGKVLYALAALIFLGAIYTVIYSKSSYIITIPNLLGLDSKFFNAGFSQASWYFVKYFPRTLVMSIYPNGTGITLLLIHSIYLNFNYNKSTSTHLLVFIIFLLCIFTTGSRAFLLLAIFLFIVYFIKSKSRLWLLSFLVPFLLAIVISVSLYLLEGRKGSNEMRLQIYLNSFHFMMETNPIFGLGLKPLIPELTGKYPIGSHSTPIGYIIKNGLVGGGIIVITYLIILFKYFVYLFELVFTDRVLNSRYLYLYSSFITILLASFFEDFDALETMPFYFGIVIWQFFRLKEHENK